MVRLQWHDTKDIYQPTEKYLIAYLEENKTLLDKKDSIIIERHLLQGISLFVSENAIEQLTEHLSEDTKTETGGILVGKAYVCPETNTNYTEILGAIPALHTIRNTANFRFTADCWLSILSTQKRDYPNTTIVGWYHSHPNFGVFLSATDLKTQKLCFKQNWQVAIVYDPIRRQIGFFHGETGITVEPIYLKYAKQNTNIESADIKIESVAEIATDSADKSMTNSDRWINCKLFICLIEFLSFKRKNL